VITDPQFARVRLDVAEASLIPRATTGGVSVIAAWRTEPVRSAPQPEGGALTAWLALIGWQIEIDEDGVLYVAVAHHITADGERLSVGACAPSRSEAVWQIFEAAMGKLGADDTGREILRGRAAA
jgi:hypothetical protein